MASKQQVKGRHPIFITTRRSIASAPWTVVEIVQVKTPLGSDGRGPRTGLRRMTAALLLGTALIGVPVGAVLTFDRSAVAQNQAEAPTSIVPSAPRFLRRPGAPGDAGRGQCLDHRASVCIAADGRPG